MFKQLDIHFEEDITFLTLISKNDCLESVKICQINISLPDEEDNEEGVDRPSVEDILNEKLNLIKVMITCRLCYLHNVYLVSN